MSEITIRGPEEAFSIGELEKMARSCKKLSATKYRGAKPDFIDVTRETVINREGMDTLCYNVFYACKNSQPSRYFTQKQVDKLKK